MMIHQQQSFSTGRAACRNGVRTRMPLPFAMPSVAHQHSSAVRHVRSSRDQVVAAASKLDNLSLFGDSTSMFGGPSAKSEVNPKEAVMKVPLVSKVSMDYTALRDYLAEGEFRQAEDETRLLLIKLAGPDAVKRNWVYFTEVKSIAVEDFQTMDQLWKASSNGKFGYSVQKEIWMQNAKRWPKFFKQIDWVQGENNNYRKWPMEFTYSTDAARGHLPLTNALRGTQLFQAILEHPAFEAKSKQSIDDRAASAASSTVKLF